jgi:PAS domain S-box-containing protein
MLSKFFPRQNGSQGAGQESEVHDSEHQLRQMLDALPAAIYTTDSEGRLTYFNSAAVAFSGRVPELGTDQWCVSWKLYYSDGRPMPHDECPMALAIKEGRTVYGIEAIAERPDGKRIWFTPYPTALRDDKGQIVGGINMLVDITERKHAEEELLKSHEQLRAHAEKLATFNRVAVGRELRMIELKKEVNALCERLGMDPSYPLEFERGRSHTIAQNFSRQTIAIKGMGS